MISRLRWDTTFDHKGQAVLLQERLSDWSGFHIQRELTTVFDKFCPPQQTWRIQSLELDLGTIDFEHLESELPAKFRQQLSEKLMELILYSHQYGRHLEIFDEKKSHVELIRHFLWYGMLPWNYRDTEGSVNQILSTQLQNNREEFLTMLKESGFSAEQVRQRMAWQFSEPNMIRVIEGIEPDVGGQIILFSNELTKIQQKETIVQASSTTDFKKNLWFWVLNYLLTERGTVFNRIQFMKSSIHQMAAHYNMQYAQLLELIELSVAKLSGSLSLQPDFILTLKLLSKENKRNKKKKPERGGDGKSDWLTLETLFRDQSLRRNTGKRTLFNELADTLSRQDAERFLKLVNVGRYHTDSRLPLINDLSDDALKTIFAAIAGKRSLMLTDAILFFVRIAGAKANRRVRNLLWNNGLVFLLEHKNSPFNDSTFFQVLIDVLAQSNGVAAVTMLEQFLRAEVPVSLKTLRHTRIYRAISAVFRAEISRMPALQFKKQLAQLLKMSHQQFKIGRKERRYFESLNRRMDRYTKTNPKQALRGQFILGKPGWSPVRLLTSGSRAAQDGPPQGPAKGSTTGKTLPKYAMPGRPEVGADRLKEGIAVRNAGLVLLSSYLSVLLNRLELIKEQHFLNTEAQLSAVHYLQYVVTGLSSTEENLLPLNKLLCGIPLSQPVMESTTLSEAHKMLMDGLIEAVIGHWPAIGKCSVDGFRGNWLVRDGLLTEKEDRWELCVEKRAYDLLIHKSSFSFSVIRYPWMDKPLYVNWPY